MKTVSFILVAALLTGPAVAKAPNGSSTGRDSDTRGVPAGSGTAPLNVPRASTSLNPGEVRRRIQARGYTEVNGLHKDVGGVWRGTASRRGESVEVWLDEKGNFGEAGGARPVAGSAAILPGGVPSTAVTDGMAGNPPGTAARRANDLAVGADTKEAGEKGSPAPAAR